MGRSTFSTLKRLTLTVGDLFDRVRTSMPMDRPGSLTPEATSDIVAYMLQANDYPSGRAWDHE